MMKRIFVSLLLVFLLTLSLSMTACGPKEQEGEESSTDANGSVLDENGEGENGEGGNGENGGNAGNGGNGGEGDDGLVDDSDDPFKGGDIILFG